MSKLSTETPRKSESKSPAMNNDVPTPISTNHILPSAPIKNTIPPVFSIDYIGKKLIFEEENKEDRKIEFKNMKT